MLDFHHSWSFLSWVVINVLCRYQSSRSWSIIERQTANKIGKLVVDDVVIFQLFLQSFDIFEGTNRLVAFIKKSERSRLDFLLSSPPQTLRTCWSAFRRLCRSNVLPARASAAQRSRKSGISGPWIDALLWRHTTRFSLQQIHHGSFFLFITWRRCKRVSNFYIAR